eukprot:gene16243-24897_t
MMQGYFASRGEADSSELKAQIDVNTSLLQRLNEAEQHQLTEQTTMAGREALLAETRLLLNSLNDENTELRDELAACRRHAEQLQAEVAQGRNEKEQAEANLKQLNFNLLYQMQEKNGLIASMRKEADGKDRRNDELQKSIEAVATQLHEASNERDRLERENASAGKALVSLEEQCSTTLARYSKHLGPELGVPERAASVDQRLDTILRTMSTKLAALEEALRAENHKASQCTSQATTQRHRLDAMEKACADLHDKLETNRREKCEAVSKLQKQLDDSRASAHSLALDALKCRQAYISAGEAVEEKLAHYKQ